MKSSLLCLMHFKKLLKLFVYFNLTSVLQTVSARAKSVLEHNTLKNSKVSQPGISFWFFLYHCMDIHQKEKHLGSSKRLGRSALTEHFAAGTCYFKTYSHEDSSWDNISHTDIFKEALDGLR